ncbi:MAG: glycoside hydrolase family 88 protein [Vicinamibacteria bacterium]
MQRIQAGPTPFLRFAAAIAVFLGAGCHNAPVQPAPSASAGSSASSSSALTTPSRKTIVEEMTHVADWQLANPSSHKLWEWHQAPFWASLDAFAPLSKTPTKYYDAMRATGEANEWRHGPNRFHADDQAITQSYFLLNAREKNPKMTAAALTLFNEMLTMPFDEALDFDQKKTSREWIWCDALFMSPPALALATRQTGDIRYADMMARLWWKTTDYLYDPAENLYYRDSRYFDQRAPNGAKVFWSRGNGWVMAGLARVLQYLPKDYAARPRFTALFKDMAAKVVTLQKPDGYWPVSLLSAESIPIPETSGTGFFTYALAWGVNERLLDRATYEPAIWKGWAALNRAVLPSGKLGYVQEVGAAPGKTGPDETEVYGVGAYLLAGSEVYRMSAK